MLRVMAVIALATSLVVGIFGISTAADSTNYNSWGEWAAQHNTDEYFFGVSGNVFIYGGNYGIETPSSDIPVGEYTYQGDMIGAPRWYSKYSGSYVHGDVEMKFNSMSDPSESTVDIHFTDIKLYSNPNSDGVSNNDMPDVSYEGLSLNVGGGRGFRAGSGADSVIGIFKGTEAQSVTGTFTTQHIVGRWGAKR